MEKPEREPEERQDSDEGKNVPEAGVGPEQAAGPAGGKSVDESWKQQVRREKEETAGNAPEGEPRLELPKPDFLFIVNSLAMQVLIYLGQIPNPATRRPEQDLSQAKHVIDMLDVLEQKTKGNLTNEEAKALQTTLYDLRMRYIGLAGGTLRSET